MNEKFKQHFGDRTCDLSVNGVSVKCIDLFLKITLADKVRRLLWLLLLLLGTAKYFKLFCLVAFSTRDSLDWENGVAF